MGKLVKWIGMFHVQPLVHNTILHSSRGAFVNTVGLASSEREFCLLVERMLKEDYQLQVIEVIEPEKLDERQHFGTIDDELLELGRCLSIDKRILFSTFHLYKNLDA